MITVSYSCDQCTAPIGELIRITATTPDCEKHFCSAICLSGWMTGRKDPSLFAAVQLGGYNSSRSQDAVQRKCDLCGRVGTRRFVPTDKDPDDDSATGWRCAPSASTKCPGNRKPLPNPVADKPAESPIRTAERTVREIVEGCFDKVVSAKPLRLPGEPKSEMLAETDPPARLHPDDVAAAPVAAPEPPAAPKPTPRLPAITARCSGCTRTWNLTGRQLEMAISMHEHRSGHVVDIEETSA